MTLHTIVFIVEPEVIDFQARLIHVWNSFSFKCFRSSAVMRTTPSREYPSYERYIAIAVSGQRERFDQSLARGAGPMTKPSGASAGAKASASADASGDSICADEMTVNQNR
jgi:hypothetical protein